MASQQRNRVFEIAAILRKSGAPEVSLIVELLGIQVETTRDDMVTAGEAEIMRAQGAAVQAQKVYRLLTQASPAEMQQERLHG